MAKKKEMGGGSSEATSGEPELTVEEMEQMMAKADDQYSAVSDKVWATASKRIMEQGMLPKNALAISPETIEEMYTKAYNFYHRGLYLEAMNNFRMLWMIDFSDTRYLMGVSACLHMMKQYEAAVKSYFMTASRDSTDPTPYYHASDCLLAMNQPTGARKVLELAIDTAGDDPKYALLKERAQLMYESLEEPSRLELAKLEQEFNAEKEREKAAKKAKKKHPL